MVHVHHNKVHVHHNKVCLAMVHVQIIYVRQWFMSKLYMSIGGICPNDTSPTMVYVLVIYVHWWYINLLIRMFIISETMFIKW